MNPVPLHLPSSPMARRRRLLAAQGLELRSMKPDELAAFGRIEISKWSELVRRSGAQID